MFNGSDYNPNKDGVRLKNQYDRIFHLMKDGRWRTLEEIAQKTKDPQASISAQLRHMKKPGHGSHKVTHRHRGGKGSGLYEYCLTVREVSENKVSSVKRMKPLKKKEEVADPNAVPARKCPHCGRETYYAIGDTGFCTGGGTKCPKYSKPEILTAKQMRLL